MEEILRLLPHTLKTLILQRLTKDEIESIEEIRLRIGRPTEIVLMNRSILFDGYKLNQEASKQFLARMSQHSVYRLEEEFKNGYITLQGGHRVGLSGAVNVINGQIKSISYVSSYNIRVAKAVLDASKHLAPYLIDQKSTVLNTLIVGPPKSGKTTLLRDLTRRISDGLSGFKKHRVSLIDERNEIAASHEGIPQHQVGLRTDVMTDVPKAEGIIMMLRSMSPEVIVVDEIGHKKDTLGLLDAIYAGVKLICTVHGESLDDIKKRPSIQPLINEGKLDRIVVLKSTGSPGIVDRVYDQSFKQIDHPSVIKHRSEYDEMDRTFAHPVHVHVGRSRTVK